jgi:molybdopterin synthase catalytic subunit
VFVVTRDPLDPAKLVEAVRRDESGAVVLFYGVVRNHHDGRGVRYLEYDAYESMAEKKLREVGEEVVRRFPIDAIAIAHRFGRLDVGETSLLVAVSSAHRADAFEAAHYCVDRIKQVVPIWKKEVWEDGSAWLEGHPVDLPEPASRS